MERRTQSTRQHDQRRRAPSAQAGFSRRSRPSQRTPAQRDDYYDRLLRKTAEFDNYRKRIERERQQLADAAAADLLDELLPLVDDLERALKADAGAEAPRPSAAASS